MKKRAKKEHRGDTPAGRRILAALRDLADTLEKGIPLGSKYTVREVTIAQPGEYGAVDVKALRRRLGLSQPVFAQLVGASSVLVQKWEAGERRPDGMARRLLDDIRREPKRWLRLLRPVPSRGRVG